MPSNLQIQLHAPLIPPTSTSFANTATQAPLTIQASSGMSNLYQIPSPQFVTSGSELKKRNITQSLCTCGLLVLVIAGSIIMSRGIS